MTIDPKFLRVEEATDELSAFNSLKNHGISSIWVTELTQLSNLKSIDVPNLVVLDIDSMQKLDVQKSLEYCSRLNIPIIALLTIKQLPDFGTTLRVDDFLLSPPNAWELLARAKRILSRTNLPDSQDTIQIRGLTINTANYEVSLNGKRVNLRFKEYELLLLMCTNPGRVYTRETLLNRVWGYDYLGGNRTVDVHIRRLRSKIEDSDHTFIETIWNVGYRFNGIDKTV